jgi:hypothetical protein
MRGGGTEGDKEGYEERSHKELREIGRSRDPAMRICGAETYTTTTNG